MKQKYKILILILVILALVISGLGWFYYANRGTMCFSNHLLEAIEVNKSRASYYSLKSSGWSAIVSAELIENEKRLLPFALLADWQAQGFIKKDIPVVCGDFIDMQNIKPKETPPLYKKAASTEARAKLSEIFSQQKKLMEASNREHNFKDVSDQAAGLLKEIEKIETEEQSSFCMSKHVVESLGYAALHASRNNELSRGRATGLLTKFIGLQIAGLSETTLNIDKDAQKVQELGLGIVCNDVPAIQFLEEWQAQKK